MTAPATPTPEALAREVRRYVFRQAAENARVPQPAQIAEALGRSQAEIQEALKHLAAGKVLILAPNDGNIWAADPFCAVPSGFRVEAGGKTYWGICIWDALGIPAALGKDAVIRAPCGDCGEPMVLEVRDGKLAMASSRKAKGSCTSPFPPATGGTTLASPEAPCSSSRAKSTSTAGAGRATYRAAPP